MWLIHPRNGYAYLAEWQKAESRPVMASSPSGQAQARASCQVAPPGVWGWCKAQEGGSTRHPLESFPTGRGYESTPRDKVQITTWPGSRGPPFCLPSTAQPDQTPKSLHAPAPLTSRPTQAAPGPEHPIPASKSFLAPSLPPGSSLPSRLGQVSLLGPYKPLHCLASLKYCFSSLEGGP